MSEKHIRWLEGELPGLVKQGIVSPQTAFRLRNYYARKEGASRRNLAVIFCSILGALLVGGGLILLLAHNWDSLSRPARVAVSLAPLVVTQVLAFRSILRKSGTPWREGVGIGLTLSVGTAMALVSQTYNIDWDVQDFLLICTLLSIPVVYLLDAAFPVVLLLAAITVWAVHAGSGGMSVIMFPALVALLVPYLWMTVRRNRHPVWQALLGWSFALVLTVGSIATMHDIVPYGLIPVFGSLFAAFVALGNMEPFLRHHWSRPFRIIGTLGVVGLSLVLTYPDLWESFRPRDWPRGHFMEGPVPVLACMLALCAPAILGLRQRRVEWRSVALAGIAVVALVTWSTIWLSSPEIIAPIVFNLYLFGLGLLFLIEGVSRQSLGTANAGTAILSVLMAVRFFDPGISFVLRGLLFIGVGAGFIVTNMYLVRKRKRVVS